LNDLSPSIYIKSFGKRTFSNYAPPWWQNGYFNDYAN